jgi:predicted RNA-binding Zn ribbon-like protein
MIPPVREHPLAQPAVGDTWRVDATDHLKASLDAAVALANSFGAEFRQGRPRGAGDAAAVVDALRLTTNRPPSIDDQALGEFASGGGRIYQALAQLTDGDTDAAARAVNELLSSTRAAPQLVRHQDSPWHLHFAGPEVSVAVGWLAEFATAAAMLLGSDDQERLRRCDAERCDNLFLDSTRNHTQRFCSTACQNRTKVAAFRSRSTEA